MAISLFVWIRGVDENSGRYRDQLEPLYRFNKLVGYVLDMPIIKDCLDDHIPNLPMHESS